MLTLANSQHELHRLVTEFVLGPWALNTLAEGLVLFIIALGLSVALTRRA